MDIKFLESALKKSWSKETCYSPTQKDWSNKNPAFGNCAITALIVQDYFDGELLYCKHYHHYWNRLPDGQEIDLTRSQFKEAVTVCADEIKSRVHVLESDSAKQAATLKRYTLLKNQVKTLLNQKMKNRLNCNDENNNWLYLMSSNASREYIKDILETLAIPFGSIQHFRYQLRWLDEKLIEMLPNKRIKNGNGLIGMKVAICYLYQERKNNGIWKWNTIYPIRIAKLVDAFKTGESKVDISHFYFQVENYIKYNSHDFNKIISKIAKEKWEKKYSFLGKSFEDKYIAKKEESMSSFHEICEGFNQDHFNNPYSSGEKYYPLFCYINGLVEENREIIAPQYNSSSCCSFYNLTEGVTHYFEFMTYTPRSQKIPNWKINFVSDSEIFSTPSKYCIEINSRYNAESLPLLSSILERNIWSFMSFKTKSTDNKINGFLPLELNINFLINIKRKMVFRIIDAFSDIGFGIGTGSLALKAVFPTWCWWHWPVIIFYSIWIICKFIIKLWRG